MDVTDFIMCLYTFYRDVLHNKPTSLFLCFNTWNFKLFVWYFDICTQYFTMYLVRNDPINECNHVITYPGEDLN